MATSLSSTSKEVPCKRTYFYVGGEYVQREDGEHFVNQMYVEELDPVQGPTKATSLVFIHGLGQTGTNWLNKPDGGRGWASFFIEKGYRVYLVDCTMRGRAPVLMSDAHEYRCQSVVAVEKYFTATAHYKAWPQAALHTQWPGTGRKGDPVFDAFYAGASPSLVDKVFQQTTLQKAGAALLDHIGQPVVLFGHSQGMMPTWLIADSRPALVHSVVALEPAGPPFTEVIINHSFARPYGLTTIPITYSPPIEDPLTDLIQQTVQPTGPDELALEIQADSPPPRQLINFVEKPVLLVTGQASYHRPYDWATVRYLQQAGIKEVRHLLLEEHGLLGNGHMFFLEKNSDEIAALVEKWLSEHGA